MKKQKEDLRIRRTYKLLSDSLKNIMKVKPFEKISVKDICDEAMVHRTTFYSHFNDKYELLKYCMDELETPFDAIEITENSAEGYKQYYMNVAKLILSEVEKNKDVYSTMIKKNKDESFLTKFQDALAKKLTEKFEDCKNNGVNIPVPIPLLASFYSGACMSVACWWFESESDISADELVKYLNSLITPLGQK